MMPASSSAPTDTACKHPEERLQHLALVLHLLDTRSAVEPL